MREGKKFKKLLIGVAAAAMTMLCTLPVSAATKSFKPISKSRQMYSFIEYQYSVKCDYKLQLPHSAAEFQAPDMILYMHMAEKQKL